MRAKVVVLAASACESARLLLNSKSPRHPERPRQRQRRGRPLPDRHPGHVASAATSPPSPDLPAHNEDGTGGLHLYMPWWLDNRKLDFPRGYHFEFGGGRDMPGYGFMGGIHRANGGGYGQKLKEDYRRYYGSFLSFAARGEMIPNADSYCELDPEAVDRYGIPVLRFHWKWSDAETLQMRHAHLVAREIIDKMGGKVLGTMPTREHEFGIQPGGEIIHEAGTTRMGESAADVGAEPERPGPRGEEPVRGRRRARSSRNPHKNATWTIMALAWRTADFIAAESRKGDAVKRRDAIGRRAVLKLLGAVPLAGGFAAQRGAGPDRARAHRAGRRRRRRLRPEVLHAPRVGHRARARGHGHPARRALGQRHRRAGARVHGLRASTTRWPSRPSASATRSRCAAGWPGWTASARGASRAGASWRRREAERKAVLDGIAYPKQKDAQPERSASFHAVAQPNKTVDLAPRRAASRRTRTRSCDRLSHGVAFFSAFRDLTASGFWSSEMGVKDIEYVGNTFVAEWKGCPPEVLAKLGLQRSEAMITRYLILAAASMMAWRRRASSRVLFDGKSTDAWRGYKRDAFPSKGWVVEDGHAGADRRRRPGRPRHEGHLQGLRPRARVEGRPGRQQRRDVRRRGDGARDVLHRPRDAGARRRRAQGRPEPEDVGGRALRAGRARRRRS